MKFFRYLSIFMLAALFLSNCKKDEPALNPSATQNQSIGERSETTEITVTATSESGGYEEAPNIDASSCADYFNYFQMGVSNTAGPAYLNTFTEPQFYTALINGGMSSVQASKTVNSLFHVPATGVPRLAYDAAGTIINTFPWPPSARTTCFFGNSLAFNANYYYPSYCGTAFIDNYMLGYSTVKSPDNCHFLLSSGHKFVLENTQTGASQQISFGPYSTTLNAMYASGLTTAEINTAMTKMGNGLMPATEFFDLIQRIVPYYPGIPSGPYWRLRQVYFSLRFYPPISSSVRYVICGDAGLCYL